MQCTLVRILQRERGHVCLCVAEEIQRQTESETPRDFKELAYLFVEADKSQFCGIDQWARDAGKS